MMPDPKRLPRCAKCRNAQSDVEHARAEAVRRAPDAWEAERNMQTDAQMMRPIWLTQWGPIFGAFVVSTDIEHPGARGRFALMAQMQAALTERINGEFADLAKASADCQ